MSRRTLAAGLWFVSLWMMYGLVASLAGLPDTGGIIIGALVASTVWLDPTHQIWGSRAA
jgi:hypothetical protein